MDSKRLNQDAMQAMARGDLRGAQALLERAVAADPNSTPARLNLAAVLRQLGDFNGAAEALHGALRLEPRNFPALLMKATLLERAGASRSAADAYGHALAQAPPDHHLDPATLKAVERARSVYGRHQQEMERFIRAELEMKQGKPGASVRTRIDSFIGTTLRTRKRYQQEPVEYFYPGMPAIEFYDRGEFPWLEEFEAATASIRTELTQIVREDAPGFKPYIHYDDHLPLDQWKELNHSPRWSAFHFYDGGVLAPERAARAPETVKAVSRLPQARIDKRSPTAMFSVLQPKTRIPPHTGVANIRLVVHLPLIVPAQCGFRVGGETREWRVGEAWVFDDTIEHEAWNMSDEVRVILICDIWSPRLSAEEREIVSEIIAATDRFNGVTPDAHI